MKLEGMPEEVIAAMNKLHAPIPCAGSQIWNLERMDYELLKAKDGYVPPTGTKIEQAREVIQRCEALEIKLRDQAIEAENAGDHEACWLNMATRAENARFMERVRTDLLNLQNVKGVARRRMDVQSEANKRRYPPLPLPSCSPFVGRGVDV